MNVDVVDDLSINSQEESPNIKRLKLDIPSRKPLTSCKKPPTPKANKQSVQADIFSLQARVLNEQSEMFAVQRQFYEQQRETLTVQQQFYEKGLAVFDKLEKFLDKQ